MKKLEDLMARQWMVGSFEGHAIFWNHANTFNTYAIADNGDATPVTCNSAIAPANLSEVDKLRWAIKYGRELAAEMTKDTNE